MMQFDERDTIFSRLELVPGSEHYASYYNRRPELKEIDDRFRSAVPGVYAHHRINTARVDSAFRFLKDIRSLACRYNPVDVPDSATLKGEDVERALHETALEYGAVLYGQYTVFHVLYVPAAARVKQFLLIILQFRPKRPSTKM